MIAHVAVMNKEILALFNPQPNTSLLDATIGLGGHSKEFLLATNGSGLVVGLDADKKAVDVARQRLDKYSDRVTILVGNFANLKDSVAGGGILSNSKIPSLFDYILFDLGIGSHQLADNSRGFSFKSTENLMMNYGGDSLPPSVVGSLNMLEVRLGRVPQVSEMLSQLTIDQLAEIFLTYGEEKNSWRIARAIKKAAQIPATGVELAALIEQVVPRHGKTHPATKIFQALRLAANRELEALQAALPQAIDLLAANGILAVLSFHSLEDRIVKHFLKSSARLQIITKRPLVPTLNEVRSNPRARSAKLRAAQRVD